jgi:hypothetical protein
MKPMAQAMPTTRRDWLRRALPALVALAFLRRPASAAAAEGKPAAPPGPKTRPPRTCRGWTDRAGNGICDRSEVGASPCRALQCSASKANPARRRLAAAGAPEGVCALWTDPARKGFCAASGSVPPTCLYVPCPAHRQHPRPTTGSQQPTTGQLPSPPRPQNSRYTESMYS